jgi:hypothetical protein
VGDLFTQHLDELEAEAERKEGIVAIMERLLAQVYEQSIAAAWSLKD